MIKRSLFVAVLLLQGGCTPFFLDDSCGPVQRSTAARGEFRDGGTVVATAMVSVHGERGAPSALGVLVMGTRGSVGAPLRGHVVRTRLVNGATGAGMREIPMQPPPVFGDEVFGNTSVGISDEAAYKRVLRDGDGLLVLDLDDGRQLSAPLPEVFASDWGRASCS